jgi:ElaB/YqjD/DUF883 family membrane-anchored ribosome-binding protein
MPSKNQSTGGAISSDVERAGSDVTQRAREAAQSVTDVANETIDNGRSTVADGLDSAASAIRDRADALPGGEGVRHFARRAADRLGNSADYVRTGDPGQIVADAGRFIKNNPGPALMVAAAFGFIVGRALPRE